MNNKVLILYLFSILMVISSCKFDRIEKVKIVNPISKENIFLKYYAWGLSDELNVISLNNRSEWPDSSKDYVTNRGAFFYKLKNDTLFLYGVWDSSKLNGQKYFKTKINFIELQNYDFIELCKNYKKRGMHIFPPSWEKYAKNY